MPEITGDIRVVASIERKTGLSALDPGQVEVIFPELADLLRRVEALESEKVQIKRAIRALGGNIGISAQEIQLSAKDDHAHRVVPSGDYRAVGVQPLTDAERHRVTGEGSMLADLPDDTKPALMGELQEENRRLRFELAAKDDPEKWKERYEREAQLNGRVMQAATDLRRENTKLKRRIADMEAADRKRIDDEFKSIVKVSSKGFIASCHLCEWSELYATSSLAEDEAAYHQQKFHRPKYTL